MPASQIVTLVLAAAGTVTGAIALWIQRRNAQDALAAQRAAADAKATADQQSLAHLELIDALAEQHKQIDRYRDQVDRTRQEMGRLQGDHERCQRDLRNMGDRLRIAEARIAELGG